MSTIDPGTAPTEIQQWLSSACEAVNQRLDKHLALPDVPKEDPVYRLAEAMRYAVLGGGKRLRPALVLASCEACGGNRAQALDAAAAVEILHAYTLVHDDLPAMDDDDTRRGRPTVHIKYDVATALLVGDALLTLAFGAISGQEHGAAQAVGILAARAGRDQLIGGQMLDLQWQEAEHQADFDEVERLHHGKTGALFAASCELGATASGADVGRVATMGRYGMAVGVAFQHADDLDDGDFPEQAARAKERRRQLARDAEAELESLGEDAALLRSFAQWIGQA
ncbi:MAG: polyprenyl synthetase family protein [Myxococcales bacterium]|nr:polyprenyl synthetase family protein [Myxococcales bacterium]